MNKIFKDNPNTEYRIFEDIMKTIKELQYGNITVLIQDSKIVQIHKTEKLKVRNY